MDTFANAILGIVFLLLSGAGTFLMFRLWGYPFDHERLKSSAPAGLMLLHRIIGYAYGIVYLFLMTQMLPRLWSYEVEFPARTVAHLTLGMAIGIILLVKISIVRFFKHLESTLVPFLGTGLFICTFLLIGLSVPFALKEVYLHRQAVGGTAFSPENVDRVKTLLVRAGLDSDSDLDELVTVGGLKQGRDILLTKCVQCHDLRTVLLKPRTPDNWVQTVRRMAERAFFNPINEREERYVSAYLIAISPQLQQTFRQKREQELEAEKSKAVAGVIVQPAFMASRPTRHFELSEARQTFEETCSQCHGLKNVEKAPPASAREALELVARMVDNGLEAPQEELEQIVFYLTNTYVNKRTKNEHTRQ